MCNIVSSITAAIFIFIRQNRSAPMSNAEPPEDKDHRGIENAVMLGFFVVLVAAGVWLLMSMADVRKAQDCAAQGRRNCGTIESPSRSQ